jgi:effector-binding domain-containing protein
MTETPRYELIERREEVEIRRYAGYIKAEVTVDGQNYKSAVERGFRVLAEFIFGNNVSRQKIEMTTPVQARPAEKIAMTTPVTMTLAGQYVVAFIMPASYTVDTLPLPNDPRIRISTIPEHIAAAIRFNGYFSQQKIDRNKERLARWLEEQGLEADGDFTLAGYNPPWVPGFLARNEVMVKLKGTKTDIPAENQSFHTSF